ncbi:MAG: hypothetical protein AAFU03_08275, partial [Bacteroidota bacterium]
KEFPNFLYIDDSIKLGKDSFQYQYQTNFRLVIPELTDIAWEATKTAGLTGEMPFSCLYDIESAYLLQNWVTTESNEIIDPLLDHDLKEFHKKMLILRETFIPELIDRFAIALETLDECL